MVEHVAKVIEVIDGDTLVCNVETMFFGMKITVHDVHVRLLGVNTPERKQPGYYEAKSYAYERLMGKQVILKNDQKMDVFDRLLAIVEIDGVDFNQELLDKGLAVEYKRK